MSRRESVTLTMPRMGWKGDGRQRAKRLVPATAPDGEPVSGPRGAEQMTVSPSAYGLERPRVFAGAESRRGDRN